MVIVQGYQSYFEVHDVDDKGNNMKITCEAYVFAITIIFCGRKAVTNKLTLFLISTNNSNVLFR
jgi:hypothetical protein